MGEDWRSNHPRRPGSDTQGKSLTEWYRDKIEEFTAHDQFVEIWDKRIRKTSEQSGGQPVPPWQGITEIAQAFGINLGELWKTREAELKALRETADASAKEVHELRIREIDQRVDALKAISDKVALALAQPQQGAHGDQGKTFLEKLDDMTEGLVSRRFIAMLAGGGGGGDSAPRDPVDELIAHEEKRTKLRNFFGLGPSSDGNVSALAQSGNIRGEVLKLLLEDDRERLKIDRDHDIQVERNKHLGELTGIVKENLGDGIRALTMAAEESRGQGAGTATQQDLEVCECGVCKTRFTIPKGALEKGQVGCPKCHTLYGPENEVKSG